MIPDTSPEQVHIHHQELLMESLEILNRIAVASARLPDRWAEVIRIKHWLMRAREACFDDMQHPPLVPMLQTHNTQNHNTQKIAMTTDLIARSANNLLLQLHHSSQRQACFEIADLAKEAWVSLYEGEIWEDL